MTASSTTANAGVAAELSFTRSTDVVREEPDAPLRARTLDIEAMANPDSYDQQSCWVQDCSVQPTFTPQLAKHGFTRADLSSRTELQAVFEKIRRAGAADDRDAQAVRKLLSRTMLPLSDGSRLFVLYIAPEGLIVRTAGPNRMAIARDGDRQGVNGHDAAMTVHADQDVEGTPVRQILRKTAPWLFHHNSPTRKNSFSPLYLVNLWVPLDQVTRPLALMDGCTLNRRAHQLRYGLPTEHFLQRRSDMRVNDIWTFLHDSGQEWYFSSQMDARQAYVFETLATPHGAIVLPGEARAEARYRQLQAAIAAVEAGDPDQLRVALNHDPDPTPAPVTASLSRAIGEIEAALDQARSEAEGVCGPLRCSWLGEARVAASRVIRKSLEMRVVGLRLPAWAFGR
ncbi:MAG: hypothetical protein ACPG4T_08855 [Nannocystaceae bacterium]